MKNQEQKNHEESVKPNIIHILKNGEVRESMDGYFVPYNEDTKAFYMLMASINEKK